MIPLSLRLRLELGGALALVLAGVWLYFHIENIGEKKVEARVAAALAAQKAQDQKDIDNAQSSLAELQARFDGALTAVPAPDVDYSVRVCGHPVRPGPSRTNAGAGPRGDDAVRSASGVAEGSGQGADVTAVTEKILSDAGARIEYLQNYIRTCQKEGFCDANP